MPLTSLNTGELMPMPGCKVSVAMPMKSRFSARLEARSEEDHQGSAISMFSLDGDAASGSRHGRAGMVAATAARFHC